jgi:negative regulator of flagellin synthesis FlgM
MSQKIDGNLSANSVARTGSVSSKVSTRNVSDDSKVESTSSSDSLRLTGQATNLQTVQRELSQTPAVDSGRVQSVKNSLQDGSYKIDTQNIANRMLQLDSQLAA